MDIQVVCIRANATVILKKLLKTKSIYVFTKICKLLYIHLKQRLPFKY